MKRFLPIFITIFLVSILVITCLATSYDWNNYKQWPDENGLIHWIDKNGVEHINATGLKLEDDETDREAVTRAPRHTTEPQETTVTESIRGDINEDGKVNAIDASILKDIIVGN